MIYLSGVRRQGMAYLATKRTGQPPFEGQVWAADNGRYNSPDKYTDEGYLGWLDSIIRDGCLFATAPDVVGDAAGTLLMSAPLYAPIRRLGYPVALVAQDGLERLMEFVPWDDIDCIFIGGTTEWKMGPGARTVASEAKRRGKWLHMGRVNSLTRMQYAESIGCDSADGTVLKHDKSRPVQSWERSVRQNPSLWGQHGPLKGESNG